MAREHLLVVGCVGVGVGVCVCVCVCVWGGGGWNREKLRDISERAKKCYQCI